MGLHEIHEAFRSRDEIRVACVIRSDSIDKPPPSAIPFRRHSCWFDDKSIDRARSVFLYECSPVPNVVEDLPRSVSSREIRLRCLCVQDAASRGPHVVDVRAFASSQHVPRDVTVFTIGRVCIGFS